MKFENIRVMNFENALRGMRNPKESWDLIDSNFTLANNGEEKLYVLENSVQIWIDKIKQLTGECSQEMPERIMDFLYFNGTLYEKNNISEVAYIGPNDMKLARQLIRAGSEHRKFLRQIFVSMDITAPLYVWKELDTYKVGTVANSTSTMHKLMSKPITIDCFEIDDFENIIYPEEFQREDLKYFVDPDVIQMVLIPYLEYLRQRWLNIQKEIQSPQGDPDYVESLEKKAKKIWKELVRWLPEAWLQKRTITMNYENLLSICSRGQRRFHKLNEWSGIDDDSLPNFVNTIRTLPYAKEFIFIDEEPSDFIKLVCKEKI